MTGPDRRPGRVGTVAALRRGLPTAVLLGAAGAAATPHPWPPDGAATGDRATRTADVAGQEVAADPVPPAGAGDGPAPKAALRAQRLAGWTLLSGDDAGDHWRAWGGTTLASSGWQVADGVLTPAPAGAAQRSDLVSRAHWPAFDLRFHAAVGPGGNSGVFYRVDDLTGPPGAPAWMRGPEFQVLDDVGHGFPPDGPAAAGALYDIIPPPADKWRAPLHAFDRGRIVLDATGRAEHWLNGRRLLSVDLEAPAFRGAVAASKFRSAEGFAAPGPGRIALQDHGPAVRFRSIFIRMPADLPAWLRAEARGGAGGPGLPAGPPVTPRFLLLGGTRMTEAIGPGTPGAASLGEDVCWLGTPDATIPQLLARLSAPEGPLILPATAVVDAGAMDRASGRTIDEIVRGVAELVVEITIAAPACRVIVHPPAADDDRLRAAIAMLHEPPRVIVVDLLPGHQGEGAAGRLGPAWAGMLHALAAPPTERVTSDPAR
ncbi:MAG: DUF1080 domain-containing protein [Phycisphaeraceae bacterium]|nr:DUF1080 domain-containing protein [Phycisphaeraceae bacterium]